VKSWKAALAASVAAAVIALIVVAPMAQSSRNPGLKVVSVTSGGTGGPNTATAKCPRGFVAIAGGFDAQQANVVHSGKRDKRRWTVRAEPIVPTKRGQLLHAQAVCAKGTGGFHIKDAGLR
jgi:hypothetical protein